MAWPSFADILSKVRTELNETAAGLWTDAELEGWINDGQRDIAAKTLCIDNVAQATTTANSRVVPWSGTKVKYVEYIPSSGKPVALQKIQLKQIGRIPANSTTPQYWAPWASSVGQCIILDPKPGATTFTLNLYVADYPAYELSSASDTPLLPSEFHLLVVDYAVYVAFLKARKWSQANVLYQSYIHQINALRPKYAMPQIDTLESLKVPDVIQYQQADGGP